MRPFRFFSGAVVVILAAGLCAGQNIMPARSGTLHFVNGDVSIDGAEVRMKAGIFPEVRPGSVLRTQLGKAEMLLTPGVFLRMGDNSAIRMVDADLSHTRVEVVAGTVMVEADDPQLSVKNSPVTLTFGETQIRIIKHGLVEIGADAGQVNVFRGEAEVADESGRVILKDGHYSRLTGELKAQKFDSKVSDELLAWSKDRSQELSAANMFAAGAINTGYGYTSNAGYGYGTATPWNGGWYYNPLFSMFTFVPVGGMFYSPFGYGFYSPGAIFGYNGIPVGVFRAVVANQAGAPALNAAAGSGFASSLTRQAGAGTGVPPALGSALRSGAAAQGAASAAAGGFQGAARSAGGGASFGATSRVGGGGGGMRAGGGGHAGGHR